MRYSSTSRRETESENDMSHVTHVELMTCQFNCVTRAASVMTATSTKHWHYSDGGVCLCMCDASRYQMFLQLKLDLLTGRLQCCDDDVAQLSALALQCKSFHRLHASTSCC